MDLKKYLKRYEGRGIVGHDNERSLKVVLSAYMNGIIKLRNIVALSVMKFALCISWMEKCQVLLPSIVIHQLREN